MLIKVCIVGKAQTLQKPSPKQLRQFWKLHTHDPLYKTYPVIHVLQVPFELHYTQLFTVHVDGFVYIVQVLLIKVYPSLQRTH